MPLPRTLEPEVMDTVEDAVDYDGMDHSTVNQVFVEDLLQFLNAANVAGALSSSVLVDLGTGTARIPLELAERWTDAAWIAACDLSFEMLKLGRRHIVHRRREEAVCPIYCDARRLPFATDSVGGVISNSIVHHIPDPVPVLRETRRVLRPGGIVYFRDLLRPESSDEVDRLVQQYAGDENEHSQCLFRESLHAALTVDEMTQILNDAGLTECVVTQTSDRHWTVSGTA